MAKTYAITKKMAQKYGLEVCESCGHPENNHFNHGPKQKDKVCAHCAKGKCKGFKGTIRSS